MTTLHRWLLAFYSSLLIAVCGAFALLAWDQERQLDVDLRGFRFVSSITSGESEKGEIGRASCRERVCYAV